MIFMITKLLNKKIFLFALILVASLGFAGKTFAATGDITAVRITNDARGEGWVAEIDITGLSTGGTYNFNLGTNNATTTNTPYFTVTSQGYDNSGNATTITRTVYATNYERKIYPSDATANETAGAGFVTVRVALSDWIYSSDTLTFTAPATFYTQGSGNNTVSGLSVTNNSVEAYPKVIANWSYPGYSRITGSTFNLRAVAFHRSAQQGRPVRAVKYTCADQHSNTATNIVTSPTIDGTLGDAEPVIEYIGTINTSGLTQGDVLTCNFIAYPWYGDSGSILNTGDGANTMPTPLYAPQTYLLDKTGAYGSTVAVVDPVSGVNATGVAVDSATFNGTNDNATTHPFLNIFAAANAIAAYNNTNHSRNDVGGGVIYLKEGSHVWTGGTLTAGAKANANAWVTVTKFPGATRANVLISSAGNDKLLAHKLKLEDVRITNSTVIGFTGMDSVWVNNSDIYPTAAATFYTNTLLYITGSNINDNGEMLPYSTVTASRALIRGSTSTATNTTGARPYVMIGNHLAFSGGATVSSDYSGQTTPVYSNTIYAFNFLTQFTATSPLLGHLNSSVAMTTGIAIVQNILEQASSGSVPLVQIAADTSTSNPVNNILIWNNSLIGQRINATYNDINLNGTAPAYRRNWSIEGNIFDDYNEVTDSDSHGGTPDAARYGNHSSIHGAGLNSNVLLQRVGAIPGFVPKFIGLNSVSGSSLNPFYVSDKSYVGTGAGNGNYRLTASSPALNLIPSGGAVLPFDLAGNARKNNGGGAAGAYEYLNTTKAITAFNFASPSVIGVVTEGSHTIALTVPFGTDVTTLVPTITQTGASVSPASGVSQNFTSPVTYTVTAEDSTTQAYTVTVTVAVNTATTITSFNFSSPATTGTVDNSAHTVALTVPFGTSVTSLTPTIVLATGATISPTSGVAQNFTSPVTYTVTAQDTTTHQAYVATVTVASSLGLPTATSVTVSGTKTVGQTLTGTYTFSDPNSLPESGTTYAWLRSSTSGGSYVAIGGATATTHVLTASDIGQYLKFQVTPQSGSGTGSASPSSATTQIQSSGVPTASSVSISGTVTEGQTLTGNYTYAQADSVAQGVSTFRWLESDTSGGSYVAIGGATANTYSPAPTDVGKYIKFEVTPLATYPPTNGSPVTSSNVGPIVASSLPVASAVALSGTQTVGNVLTGSYTYSDAGSHAQAVSTFRWLESTTANGTYSAISSATSLTYTLVSGDIGKYVKFEVTPVSTVATGVAVTSNPSGIINSSGVPTASSVSISGTPTIGQVLTGSYTYAQADSVAQGVSTFRWLESATSGGTYSAIAGATNSTYTVVTADQGLYIKFEVTPVATVPPTTGSAVLSSATTQVPLTIHTITASVGANGTITPSGSVSVNNGSDQAFTITANSGYHIDTVTSDSVAVSATSPYTFTNVTADHTISATFAVDAVSTPAPTSHSGGGGGCINCWVPPSTPTEGYKIFINQNASTTSNRIVTLNFNAKTDIKKIAISMTGDFADASQDNYSPTQQWDLCSKFGGLIKNPTCLNGKYTIYAKFYTASGIASPVATSSITLTNGVTNTNTTKYNFKRNLSLHMTGQDVKALQQYLNANGFVISKTGAGSPGKETTLFGTLTYKALVKFQKSIGWSGTGFFGPMTRAYIANH